MGRKSTLLAAGIGLFALVASACSIDVERNADGSLRVDAVVSESSLAAELERDPHNENVVVDVMDGFILVEADRIDARNRQIDVAFRADVSAEGGGLAVVVSDATFDGFSIPQSFVAEWNEALAAALERASRRHPDATLVAVSVGGDELAMKWRIETPESRGS